MRLHGDESILDTAAESHECWSLFFRTFLCAHIMFQASVDDISLEMHMDVGGIQ
jgi:hypothetical protein